MTLVIFSDRNPDYDSFPAPMQGMRPLTLLDLIRPAVHQSGFIYLSGRQTFNEPNFYAPLFNVAPALSARRVDPADPARMALVMAELQAEYENTFQPGDCRITMSVTRLGKVTYIAVQGGGSVVYLRPLRANIRTLLVARQP
jgi:hypothetical protein